MSLPRFFRVVLGVLMSTALAACGTVTRTTRSSVDDDAALSARVGLLATKPHWRLNGRVAVSDGKDSGSARIQWDQDGEYYTISLRAPVSGSTWRLTGDADQCQLEGVKPYPLSGHDPEELLARELGWHFPLRQLREWVRALPAARDDQIAFDDDGLPQRMDGQGWTIEYRDWHQELVPPMPGRIFARHAPYEVRMAVADWQLYDRE